MWDDLDLTDIPDMATARAVIERVLNLVEALSAELATAKVEIQQLRDENSRLKGEQPKPRILPNKRGTVDQSSEQERREGGQRGGKGGQPPGRRADPNEGRRRGPGPAPQDAVATGG